MDNKECAEGQEDVCEAPPTSGNRRPFLEVEGPELCSEQRKLQLLCHDIFSPHNTRKMRLRNFKHCVSNWKEFLSFLSFFPSLWQLSCCYSHSRALVMLLPRRSSAAMEKNVTAKMGAFLTFVEVTVILLISVCRLSSLIPKPTCPPLLTLAQAVLCVSASALLLIASKWLPGQHLMSQGEACPWLPIIWCVKVICETVAVNFEVTYMCWSF